METKNIHQDIEELFFGLQTRIRVWNQNDCLFFLKGEQIYFRLNIESKILWMNDRLVYQSLRNKFNNFEIEEILQKYLRDSHHLSGISLFLTTHTLNNPNLFREITS